MKILFAALVTVLLLLVGCTTDGKVDLFKGAETAVHLKLLDAEFDATVARIRALPLDAKERMAMDQLIAAAQLEREFLRTLHKQNAGRIAIEGIQAQSHLDDTKAIVQDGRAIYLAHLERTKKPVDPALKASYESAALAGTRIQEAINSGKGVTGTQLSDYLTLALRVLAASQGVPVVEKPGDTSVTIESYASI